MNAYVLLLTTALGQVAGPFVDNSAPIAGAYAGEIQLGPVLPDDAICHETAGGAECFLVPSELRTQTVMVCKRGTCGMICNCPRVWWEEEEVAANKPTPLAELEGVLEELDLGPEDVLYDLGCADGRVCVLAAKLYKCRTVGLDIDEEAVELARRNAKLNGVSHLARFYVQDAREANLSHATVLYAFLEPATLAPLFGWKRPNVRAMVSYLHAFPSGRENSAGFYLWRRPLPAPRTVSTTYKAPKKRRC